MKWSESLFSVTAVGLACLCFGPVTGLVGSVTFVLGLWVGKEVSKPLPVNE